jgi:hypothetical protein
MRLTMGRAIAPQFCISSIASAQRNFCGRFQIRFTPITHSPMKWVNTRAFCTASSVASPTPVKKFSERSKGTVVSCETDICLSKACIFPGSALVSQ